jgi:hypothetical protein
VIPHLVTDRPMTLKCSPGRVFARADQYGRAFFGPKVRRRSPKYWSERSSRQASGETVNALTWNQSQEFTGGAKW